MALIVGGSRGIGEATAKLVVAGSVVDVEGIHIVSINLYASGDFRERREHKFGRDYVNVTE